MAGQLVRVIQTEIYNLKKRKKARKRKQGTQRMKTRSEKRGTINVCVALITNGSNGSCRYSELKLYLR